MLGSKLLVDTNFRTLVRGVFRTGALCGVLAMVMLNMGGCPMPVACMMGDACDDEDACTTDACTDGFCANTAVECAEDLVCDPADGTCRDQCNRNNDDNCADDGNECTDEVCNDEGFCRPTNNTADCDDEDACTEDDACANGVCAGTDIPGCCAVAMDCDDMNPCTDETCTDGMCGTTNNTSTCDDGDPCTTGDVCAAGMCDGTPCPAGQDCDPASPTGPCVNVACMQASECEDNDACTVNQCVANLCDFTEQIDCPVTVVCTESSCVAGACTTPVPTVCPAGEECDPGTGDCVPETTEFTVTVTCPGSLAQDGSGAISAAVANASPTGTVTFQWVVVAGGGTGTFDDATDASTDFTLTSASGVTLQVTATDDGGTPDDAATPEDETADDEVVTDECDIALGDVPFQVNAGSDRILVPIAGDFAPMGIFGANGQLVSGSATAPGLAAVTNRGVNANVSFQWEVVSVPTGAAVPDLTIINTSAAATGYLIIPALTNSALGLRVTGLTGPGTIMNTVIPGNYVFRVTGIDLDAMPTQTDTDEVTYTFIPAFAIPAAAAPGSLQGLAVTNGGLSDRMVRPATAATVAYQALARLAGTLQYILTDTSVATDVQVAANQNAVALTVASPVAAVAADAAVTATTRGTYTVNASYSAGAGSVASTPTGVAVHVQPALPSAVDVRAPAAALSTLQTFGVVSSTSVAATPIVNIHGARQFGVGAGSWDGTAVAAGDINGDGLQEILTATFTGGAIKVSIYHGVTVDPTVNTNSPRPNVINNNGTLTTAGGLLDSFTITVVGVASVSAIAVGDIDGDTRLDLAVGDSSFNGAGAAGTEGRVFLFYNQSHIGFALNPYNTVASAGVLLAGGALAPSAQFTRDDDAAGLDSFGHALAIGDVSGDNIGDLVVGAPNDGQGTATLTGAVYGFLGSAARYTGTTTVTDAGAGANFRLVPTGSLTGDMVGAAVAVAPVDTAVGLDVIYGAPGFSTITTVAAEAGRVLVNFGGSGLTGATTTVGRNYEGNAANLGFGRRIATCSFRGGTTTDIIVSAEANTAGTHVIASAVGRVFDFPATQGGFINDGNTTLGGLPQIGGGGIDSNLGSTMACGDFNNDGFADLLLLAASVTPATQRILLVNGSAAPAATLTANTTFMNAAGVAFLTTPVAPGALTTTAATYNANGASMDADVNGDTISDLFWQGLIGGVTEAAVIAGAP